MKQVLFLNAITVLWFWEDWSFYHVNLSLYCHNKIFYKISIALSHDPMHSRPCAIVKLQDFDNTAFVLTTSSWETYWQLLLGNSQPPMTNSALESDLPCASCDEFITKPVNLLLASASSVYSALRAYELRQLLPVDQGLQFWWDQPTSLTEKLASLVHKWRSQAVNDVNATSDASSPMTGQQSHIGLWHSSNVVNADCKCLQLSARLLYFFPFQPMIVIFRSLSLWVVNETRLKKLLGWREFSSSLFKGSVHLKTLLLVPSLHQKTKITPQASLQ